MLSTFLQGCRSIKMWIRILLKGEIGSFQQVRRPSIRFRIQCDPSYICFFPLKVKAFMARKEFWGDLYCFFVFLFLTFKKFRNWICKQNMDLVRSYHSFGIYSLYLNFYGISGIWNRIRHGAFFDPHTLSFIFQLIKNKDALCRKI